jgi:uncharacterized protein YjdB
MKKNLRSRKQIVLLLLAFTTFLSTFAGQVQATNGLESLTVDAPEATTDLDQETPLIEENLDYVKDKVLIKYKFNGFRLLQRKPVLPRRSGITNLREVRFNQNQGRLIGDALTFNQSVVYEADIVTGLGVENAVKQLNQMSNVEIAEPIYIRKVDGQVQNTGEATDNSLVSQQYYLNMINLAPAKTFLQEKGINPGGARDIIVAVIDTGVDYNHEDLAANMWVNTGEIPDNGIDDDNNGYIDDVHGINTIGNNYTGHSGDPLDDHGHGTHVAGIIAADGSNGKGITGVASNVRIMALKAGQQSGILLTSDIVEALDYARKMGADVINMSYGGYSASNIEREALELAFNGAALIAAAGNDASTTKPHFLGKNMYPASYPWVLGVMATDSTNTLANFSNFDFKPRDYAEYEVAVPGSQIISTLPNNRYAKWSGTSMAAPIVAGQAALLKSYFNDPMSHSSRFIMGQIIGTGKADVTIPRRLIDLGLTVYSSYSGIDIFNSLDSAPKPELSLFDTFIWDPTSLNSEFNNANGVLDNGEKVELAIEIRNHWGKADNVDVKIDTKNTLGIDNPYVTILTDTVNYGAVGTFNHDDNGFIYDENKEITGIRNPFVIQVAENAPNDSFVVFNVTMTAYNGLDPADTDMYTFLGRFVYSIRNGTILPNVISTDMVLTKDRYWIIPNATIILEQATVTVEPGTQIQFWSNDADDPYATNAITYLRVDGKFITNGTTEEPVKIFPSDIRGDHEVRIIKNTQTNSYISLNYTEINNPRVEADEINYSKFRQNFNRVVERYLTNEGTVASNWYISPFVFAHYISNSIFKELGTTMQGSRIPFLVGKHSWHVSYNVGANHSTYKYSFFQGHLYNNLFDSNFLNLSLGESSTVAQNTFLNNYLIDEYGNIVTSRLSVRNENSTNANNYTPSPSSINYNSVTGTTYFVLEAFSWQKQEVAKFAESVGGYLASIESLDEQNYLFQRYGNQELVIGLEVTASKEVKWASGESLYFLNANTNIINAETRKLLVPEPTIYESFVWSNNQWTITKDQQIKRQYLIEIPGEIYVTDINFETSSITLGNSGKPFALNVMLTPVTANPADLIWTASDPEIASISQDSKIVPLKEGTVTVTVKSKDGVIVKTITVNVIQIVALESLELNIPATQLNVGEQVKGTVTFMPTNTTEKAVLWTSTDNSIASVDAYGNITAKKPGTVTIRVQNFEGTLFDEITITVVQPVGSVNITETNILVPLSEVPTTIAVTVGPESATNKTLIWETSNSDVAYINEEGKLVTVAYGTAILRATAEFTNIYDEVVVSVIDQTEATLEFKQVVSGRYNSQSYIFGLADGGTLWVWGGTEFLIPTKSNITGVKQISVDFQNNYSMILTNNGQVRTGSVNTIISSAKSNSNLTINNFTLINGLNNVTYVFNHYYSYFAVDSSGDAWAWGYNDNGRTLGVGVTTNTTINSPLQVLGVNNVKEIKGEWDTKYFLTTDGKIYRTVNSTDGTIMTVGSGAVRFTDNYDLYIASDNTIRYSSNGSLWQSMPSGAVSISVRSQLRYTTTTGKLMGGSFTGNEFPNHFFTEVFYLESGNFVALTQAGKVFMWGSNNHRQLANLSTSDSAVPLEINFGIKIFDVDVQVEIQNVNQGDVGVEVNTEIVLDFNTAIKASNQYAFIQLRDSTNSLVAMTRELRLDKLILTPSTNLKFNERYTVNIPTNSLQDIFGNQYAGSSFTFVTAETLGGSPEVIPVTSITIGSTTSIVDVNKSIKLTATLLPTDTTQKSVRWTSSDRTIATVDMFGNVYGKRAGQVTITASNADFSVIGTYEITVNQPVTSIEFNDTMILKNLTSEPSLLPVTILPLDATNPSITWASSNPEIAFVNEEGLLVVLSKGTSVLRATAVDGGQYDDIIVSVSEEALEQVSIKKVSQFRSNDSNTYTLALMTDGTLWVWGVNILVPTKTKFTGIKDIPVFVNLDYGPVLVLLDNGNLYLAPANDLLFTTKTNAQVFTDNYKVSGINSITSVYQTYYNTFYILRTNGDVWGWGNNDYYGLGDGTNIYRNTPQKISNVSNVVKISTHETRTLLLTNNGDLYILGGNGANYSRAFILDTNVTDIQDSFHSNYYQKADGLYQKHSPDVNASIQRSYSSTDKAVYQFGNIHSLSDDGKVNINGVELNSSIVFSRIGVLFGSSVYLISANGDLYLFGANSSGQLANFNNEQSFIPTKINFGIVVNEGGLLLDSQNVTNNATGVSITTEFVFDFNTAIKAGNNLPAITLKDSNGNFVSVSASIKLDKLFVKVDELLIYGESYTLTLPNHLVVDYFNNIYNGQTLQFTMEEAPASVAGFEANGRFFWNTADLIEAIADYTSEGGMLGFSSSFGLNAILNNIQDPRSENWMRIVGTPSEQLATVSLNYNYWGTESQNLINAQILDFDDFQTLLNIDASQIIKDDQLDILEQIYPFVLEFYFTNVNNERTDSIDLTGGTMHIIFNQDMDVTVLPNVYFGPDIPYTDYKIEGEWITARHWTGNVRVTLLTGDGYQYMRIRDAVSASNAWLVAGDDEKRLQFEIITTGTESMTLQATSAEGRVILDWMQDEFTPELMAGYNVYRSASVDGTFARVNTSIITDTTYEDFSVSPGIVYYYKFTVVQTDFSESDFSNIAAANAFDNILPVLTHNVISTIRTGQDNTIVAFASDNIAVEKVTFSYRLKDETNYTSFDMIRDGNTTKYSYSLKSSVVTTSTFEYFITAYDGLSFVTSGTAASPHKVNVLDVPTITNLSPASGTSLGGTTVTITGANFKQGVKVFFAELEGLNVTLVDANRLTVVTPRYYASQVNVKIVNPFGGEAVRTNGFTYESNEATVSIPTVKANINSDVLVPVRVTNVTGLLAVDMTISYDKDVLTYVEFVRGTMGSRFTTFVNKNTLGELRISMAVDLSVTGSGDILYLKFKVVNAAFDDSSITLDTVELNGGNIPAIKTSGLVTYEPVLTFTGTVFYFGNSKAVENVDIILSGDDNEHLGITNAQGTFTFTSVSKGNYELSLSKEDDTDAISALDAALVLQQAVGLVSLSANQQVVADVNNDGKINSLDASYILQYIAGLTVLPFAGRDSAWLFVSSHSTFTNMASNTNVSVTAYLIGDVSGNYGSTGTTVTSLDGAYRVGPIQTSQGLLYVPVDVVINTVDVFALSFRLTFDSTLRVKEVRFHEDLENAFKVANTNVAGQITVAIAGVDVLETMIGLIEVVFEPTQSKDVYAFAIVASMINESRNLINIVNNFKTITTTDFNGDNVVDQEDLVTLVDVLNKTYQDEDISAFDFNSDGIIDLFDIIAMIQTQRIPA